MLEGGNNMEGMSLYEANQSAVDQFEPLKLFEFKEQVESIAGEFFYNKENYKYFMLLCNELRDYTLFNFVGQNEPCVKDDAAITNACWEIRQCLLNRGTPLYVDFDEYGNVQIWIRYFEDEKPHAYFLFPYDEGVIEV
jgi:hypothetical protein